MTQLSEHGLVPEQWGGDTIMVEMSALQSLGIDDLLEQLLVVAEVEELTANPEGRAKGIVLELRFPASVITQFLRLEFAFTVGDFLSPSSTKGEQRGRILRGRGGAR